MARAERGARHGRDGQQAVGPWLAADAGAGAVARCRRGTPLPPAFLLAMRRRTG